MSHFFNGFVTPESEEFMEACRCKRYSPADACSHSDFVTCRPCCRHCSPPPPCPPEPPPCPHVICPLFLSPDCMR